MRLEKRTLSLWQQATEQPQQNCAKGNKVIVVSWNIRVLLVKVNKFKVKRESKNRKHLSLIDNFNPNNGNQADKNIMMTH